MLGVEVKILLFFAEFFLTGFFLDVHEVEAENCGDGRDTQAYRRANYSGNWWTVGYRCSGGFTGINY